MWKGCEDVLGMTSTWPRDVDLARRGKILPFDPYEDDNRKRLARLLNMNHVYKECLTE